VNDPVWVWDIAMKMSILWVRISLQLRREYLQFNILQKVTEYMESDANLDGRFVRYRNSWYPYI